jgi:hypothetical protein
MKIDLHQPALFARITAECDAVDENAHAFIFKPLATAALWENRIDVASRPSPVRKAYPFKRADESVN